MRYTKDNPYGYWISKTDIIPVVDEECHYEVAQEQILKREKYVSNLYSVMFRLGYVRVINYRDGRYGVQCWMRSKLSKLQKQFTKNAEHVDSVDYRHDKNASTHELGRML
jgi:hypothetical protein